MVSESWPFLLLQLAQHVECFLIQGKIGAEAQSQIQHGCYRRKFVWGQQHFHESMQPRMLYDSNKKENQYCIVTQIMHATLIGSGSLNSFLCQVAVYSWCES